MKKIKLQLAQRTKCTECKALMVSNKKYRCTLGMIITYHMMKGSPVHPVPLEKCYRPKTNDELAEAQRLMKRFK